ncbi:helix-turn-helix domain-containing protein [Xanthomonas campestris]|uniref:helix-turn-helix domain-containing protein n=1 Tax=Xanthomonas campestris TaxID=339 RepID=UPI003D001D5B
MPVPLGVSEQRTWSSAIREAETHRKFQGGPKHHALAKSANIFQFQLHYVEICTIFQGSHVMPTDSDEILTIEEMAAYLKAGKRTVYRLAADGKIPAFKVGGTWRFLRADIEIWIKQQSTGQSKDDIQEKSRKEEEN